MAHRLGTAAVSSALLALGMTAVACTSDNGDGEGRSSPTSSLLAPTGDPQSVAEVKAIEAYRGMWKAYAEAGETADPAHPDLTRYTTGEALRVLTDALKNFGDRSQVTKGEPALSPRVTNLSPAGSPTEARIADCADTTNWLIYKKSGEPVNDTPGGRRLAGATVVDTGGGVWKVSNFGVREVGTC